MVKVRPIRTKNGLINETWGTAPPCVAKTHSASLAVIKVMVLHWMDELNVKECYVLIWSNNNNDNDLAF